MAVVQPRSLAHVSQLLGLCVSERVGVVPHGGNTSYCGGAIPDDSGRQLVLSLKHLNRIRSVDVTNYSLTAEAGCILSQVQQAADAAGCFFPLSLGSQGSCQIGGNLSTNAGGVNVLRYGMMRDLVLGLEVVLPGGRVLEGLSSLRKDNTGYDIKSLFLGAEGTLGVITAATVKLFPQIRARATALVALPEVRAAVTLLGQLRAASGDRISSFELISRPALELATRHIPGVSDPFTGAHPWYLLCELSSARAAEPLDEVLEEALGAALTRATVLDAALVRSERERAALWKLSACAATRAPASNTTFRFPSRCSRILSPVPRPGSAPTFPMAGWWRTATWATATCISTSVSLRAVTASAFSVAPTACGAPCTSWYTSSAAASVPSMASGDSRWASSSATPPRSSLRSCAP